MWFQVLGPLEVVAGAGGTIQITGRRRRAVLAVLLLHPSRVVTVPTLIDGIWADDPPGSAVFNVRTYVCDIRRVLRRAGFATRLTSHPAGYRLEVTGDELDMLRFDQLVAQGREALNRADHARAAQCFGLALGLWRGRPLEDLGELGTALVAKTVALEEQRWAVTASWVDARLRLGQHGELIPQLRQLAIERPLCERTRVQLMTALHAVGRTADALASFRDARRTAVAELGVEPGRDLQLAHTAILNGEPLPVRAAMATV